MSGQHDTEKELIIEKLYGWIRQRPGLEFGNYGDVKNYRQELRGITKDLHHARQLLRAVELSSITGQELLAAFRAYSGRMTWKLICMNRFPAPCADCGAKQNREHYDHCKGGQHTLEGHRLEYCTGQYWPTEYRRVVCAIAAQALWDHYREDFCTNKKANESDGDAIRRKFKQRYGRQIADRWFN